MNHAHPYHPDNWPITLDSETLLRKTELFDALRQYPAPKDRLALRSILVQESDRGFLQITKDSQVTWGVYVPPSRGVNDPYLPAKDYLRLTIEGKTAAYLDLPADTGHEVINLIMTQYEIANNLPQPTQK